MEFTTEYIRNHLNYNNKIFLAKGITWQGWKSNLIRTNLIEFSPTKYQNNSITLSLYSLESDSSPVEYYIYSDIPNSRGITKHTSIYMDNSIFLDIDKALDALCLKINALQEFSGISYNIFKGEPKNND